MRNEVILIAEAAAMGYIERLKKKKSFLGNERIIEMLI